jgi:HlyD family secretion protein
MFNYVKGYFGQKDISSSPSAVDLDLATLKDLGGTFFLANPELKLKPGMTANVSIVVAQRKGILRVPNSALRFRPPEPQTTAAGTPEAKPRNGGRPPKGARPDRKVHLLKPGFSTPEPVPVKLGISDNLYTEVLGGLEEGATLITSLKTPAAAAVKPSANPMSGIPMRTR